MELINCFMNITLYLQPSIIKLLFLAATSLFKQILNIKFTINSINQSIDQLNSVRNQIQFESYLWNTTIMKHNFLDVIKVVCE